MFIKSHKSIREQAKVLRDSDSKAYAELVKAHTDILSPKKHLWNEKAKAIWGDQRSKAGRMRLKRYLENIKSADPFLAGVRSYTFLDQLPARVRSRIMKRVREVDSLGYKKLKFKLLSVGQIRRNSKKLMTAVDIKNDTVMLEKRIEETATASIIRLMPIGGLKNVLALCIAAGYTRDQVAGMVQMEPAELNALITSEDVKEAAMDMPKAITHLANGIVMRDLLNGMVTPMTKEADMIAHRRTKVAVDVSKETRERSKFDDVVFEQKESELTKRFGVDRKKGEVIDANSKS
jgi:hypothetical protein